MGEADNEQVSRYTRGCIRALKRIQGKDVSGSIWRRRVAAAWARPLWEGGIGVET